MAPKILSVSQLLGYVKSLLSTDWLLQDVTVSGEISSYRPHYSGHMYFTLKDESSQIKCVMFKSRNTKLNFTPDNGVHVIVRGYFSLYERDGQMQLYVEEMKEEGTGSLFAAFEKLKEKLRKEGLFDEQHKKTLPKIPRKIGVVTSLSGAVLKDIQTVLSRRYPIEIVLAPAQVQGTEAAQSIIKGIKALNKIQDVDVIIVARGGGSIEDLWTFNTEEIARAVFASAKPVISAIGHDTDYTICDFAADVRAATPSQAAELVVPMLSELKGNLMQLQSRLHSSLRKLKDYKTYCLNALTERQIFKRPKRMLVEKRQHLDFLHGKLVANLSLTYERKNAILIEKAARLEALSPLKVLARGYILCYDHKGNLIKTTKQTKINDSLIIKTTDGSIECVVSDVQGDYIDGE